VGEKKRNRPAPEEPAVRTDQRNTNQSPEWVCYYSSKRNCRKGEKKKKKGKPAKIERPGEGKWDRKRCVAFLKKRPAQRLRVCQTFHKKQVRSKGAKAYGAWDKRLGGKPPSRRFAPGSSTRLGAANPQRKPEAAEFCEGIFPSGGWRRVIKVLPHTCHPGCGQREKKRFATSRRKKLSYN